MDLNIRYTVSIADQFSITLGVDTDNPCESEPRAKGRPLAGRDLLLVLAQHIMRQLEDRGLESLADSIVEATIEEVCDDSDRTITTTD